MRRRHTSLTTDDDSPESLDPSNTPNKSSSSSACSSTHKLLLFALVVTVVVLHWTYNYHRSSHSTATLLPHHHRSRHASRFPRHGFQTGRAQKLEYERQNPSLQEQERQEILLKDQQEQEQQQSSSDPPQQPSSTSTHNEPVNLTLFQINNIDQIYIPPERFLETREEAEAHRRPIVDLLRQANVTVDLPILQRLPHWSDVTELYGDKLVVVGAETCPTFRQDIPPHLRFVGPAGQMNVGTNALHSYLKLNLQVVPNLRHKGMLVEVPWNKHAWAGLRHRLNHALPLNHTNVLPVVLIRDPYQWMQSMCDSPYTMEWNRTDHCPNLREAVSITWNVKQYDPHPQYHSRTWSSLANEWSEWYREYYDADFPRLMIRFEDLVFRTPQVLDVIRACVEAEWKEKQVVFVTQPVKTTQYFERFKAQSGMVSAMIRYGQDHEGRRRLQHMDEDDRRLAKEQLDEELMRVFGYKHPDEDESYATNS